MAPEALSHRFSPWFSSIISEAQIHSAEEVMKEWLARDLGMGLGTWVELRVYQQDHSFGPEQPCS